MSEIIKNPKRVNPVPPPDAAIFLYGRRRVNFSWKFTRKEPFWFLYYYAEPGAVLNFDGCELRPGGDEIVLIPPGTPFTSSCESSFEHIYIHFTVGRPYSQVKPGAMVFARSVCGTLDRLLQAEVPSSAAVYAFLFSALAAVPEDRFADREKPVDDRIQQAMSLLNDGFDNGEICRRIGMSQSNFLRTFRQVAGLSPQHYAMALRLGKARCRLETDDLPIRVIAAECGFSDRYAFSKAFRNYVGMPPGRYRSAAQGKDDASR